MHLQNSVFWEKAWLVLKSLTNVLNNAICYLIRQTVVQILKYFWVYIWLFIYRENSVSIRTKSGQTKSTFFRKSVYTLVLRKKSILKAPVHICPRRSTSVRPLRNRHLMSRELAASLNKTNKPVGTDTVSHWAEFSRKKIIRKGHRGPTCTNSGPYGNWNQDLWTESSWEDDGCLPNTISEAWRWKRDDLEKLWRWETGWSTLCLRQPESAQIPLHTDMSKTCSKTMAPSIHPCCVRIIWQTK